MSEKFKRQRSLVQAKISKILHVNDKQKKKLTKTPKKIPISTNHLHTTNLNFTNSKKQDQNKTNLNHFNSNHTNQQFAQQLMKLNRIQSEYIKPVYSQTSSNTVKINKININSNKPKKNTEKKYQLPNDYCISPQGQNVKKKTQKYKHKQSQLKAFQQFVKSSLKTSKISSKSLTRQRYSFDKQPSFPLNGKKIINLDVKLPHSQKSELKKDKITGLNSAKVNDKTSNSYLRKIPSSCSVKKYYVLQKSKLQKKSDTKGTAVTTSRGISNPQEHRSMGRRKSSGNTLKINNSSTDLNNTVNSSQIERQILQRVQRILQYYQLNLSQERQKIKTLEKQNHILKEEFNKVIERNH